MMSVSLQHTVLKPTVVHSLSEETNCICNKLPKQFAPLIDVFKSNTFQITTQFLPTKQRHCGYQVIHVKIVNNDIHKCYKIKESISNFSFMNKSYCLSIQSIQYSQMINENMKIANYKITNYILCSWNKSRGYKYKMINKLFSVFMHEFMCGDEIKMVIINDYQWHKVNIFNRVNNKRRMKQYYEIKNNYMNNDFDIESIPITMFNSDLNEYGIEHVWFIQIYAKISQCEPVPEHSVQNIYKYSKTFRIFKNQPGLYFEQSKQNIIKQEVLCFIPEYRFDETKKKTMHMYHNCY
eukprot:86016_1